MKHIRIPQNWIRIFIGLAAIAVSLFWHGMDVAAIETKADVAVSETKAKATVYQEGSRKVLTKLLDYEYDSSKVKNSEALFELCLQQVAESASDFLALQLYECSQLSLCEEPDMKTYCDRALAVIYAYENMSEHSMEALRVALLCKRYDAQSYAKDISTIVEKCAYGNGIMSEIYALYVAVDTKEEAIQSIAGKLMERQQANGGFGLMDNMADVDVTAMALRALQPFQGLYVEEIERGMEYLSKQQTEQGDYMSVGVANAESTAQVAMTLLCYGRNPYSDSEYMKQGQSVMDGLMAYYNEDGGFSHTLGTKSNALATLQAMEAFIMIEQNMPSTQTGFYEQISEWISRMSGSQVRLVLILVVVILVLLTVVMLILQGNRKIILYALTLLVGVALSVFLLLVPVQTPSEYRDSFAVKEGAVETSLTILGAEGEEMLSVSVSVENGASAFSQLKSAVGAAEIAIGYTGSELFGNIYVQSIGEYAERDYGDTSGWMYSVNGEYPQVSSGSYALSAGDVVIWKYVTGNSIETEETR